MNKSIFTLEKKKIENNKTLISFIFKFFIKSKIGVILAIGMPLLFMLTYYIIGSDDLKPGETNEQFANSLGAFFAMAVLPLNLISLPQMIVELKNSIIMRKIKTSGFSKVNFLLIIISFYVFISIASLFITMIIYLSFLNVHIDFLKDFNWGTIIYSLLMLVLSSVFIGFTMGAIIKNLMIAQSISFGYFFLVLILGGNFIPINVIGDNTTIKIISTLSPLNYASSLLTNSLIYENFDEILKKYEEIQQNIPGNTFIPLPVTKEEFEAGRNIFNLSSSFWIAGSGYKGEPGTFPIINVYDTWLKALNIVMPFVSIGIFSFISIKFFNWSGR